MADRITSPDGTNTVIAADDNVTISRSAFDRTNSITLSDYNTEIEVADSHNSTSINVSPSSVFVNPSADFSTHSRSNQMAPSLGDPNEPDKMAPMYDGYTRTFSSRYIGVYGTNPYEIPDGIPNADGTPSRYRTSYRDAITFEIISESFGELTRGLHAYNGFEFGDYVNPFIASQPTHLTTKQFVDDQLLQGDNELRVTEDFGVLINSGDKTVSYPNGRSWSSKGHSALHDHAAMYHRPLTPEGEGKLLFVDQDSIKAQSYVTTATPPSDENPDARDYWTYTPFNPMEDDDVTTKKYVDDNSSKFFVSATEPASMKVGDGWFNPTTGELSIYTE